MDRVRGIVERMTAEEDARVEALRREVLRDLWVAVGVALLTTIVTVAVLIGLNKLLQRYGREREGAERALRETNQGLNALVERRTEELTELSQHLIRVSEEEKASLARELHDTLGSNLTAINMDLNWISRRTPEASREVRERLQRVIQLLGETVELKHEVIEGLRPSLLDNLGLAFAMQSHCKEFTRRTGIPCEIDVVEDFDDLDPAWSIALYRIVQESLTNISKHAQASRVRIELTRDAEGVRLRIADDGVGVKDETLSKPKSHGVIGMRERMRLVGGRFAITRAPGGRGTVVEAFIPSVAPATGEEGSAERRRKRLTVDRLADFLAAPLRICTTKAATRWNFSPLPCGFLTLRPVNLTGAGAFKPKLTGLEEWRKTRFIRLPVYSTAPAVN